LAAANVLLWGYEARCVFLDGTGSEIEVLEREVSLSE
jgi:hypothetical protein